MNPTHPLAGTADQAAGLRRQFAGTTQRFIPLVANPHVAFSSVVLERITTCLAQAGIPTLLVDAADSSPPTSDMALLDLAACVERCDEKTYYLAARGLPRAHMDTRGSAARLLDALSTAAPHAAVVLVHGEADELARVFVHGDVRPVLIAADATEAVKHAYAACKLLSARAVFRSFDVLLCAAENNRHASAITTALSKCAQRYFQAQLMHWALIDPASDVGEAPSPELRQLLAQQMQLGDASALFAPAPQGLGKAARSAVAPSWNNRF